MTIYRLLCTVLLVGFQFISTNEPHNLQCLSFTVMWSTVALPHRNSASARTSSDSCGAWDSYRVILWLEAPNAIRQEIQAVNDNTLGKVFQNLEKRIQVCLDVKGDQFQHRL